MQHPFDAILRDPWRMLSLVLDGPLHPGGHDATERLLDRAGVVAGTRVLDIGCGAGGSLTLARARGAHAIGLDREPTTPGAIRGDMNRLPFRDDSVDVVLGECVLCLSPSLDRTLHEIERILTPDGRLAFADVTVEGKPPTVPAPIDHLLCLDGPRDPTLIRRQIAAAGFDITDEHSHHDDLLAMRAQLKATLDYERLLDVMGDRGARLQDGVEELDAAVETGRIGYRSIVATTPPR